MYSKKNYHFILIFELCLALGFSFFLILSKPIEKSPIFLLSNADILLYFLLVVGLCLNNNLLFKSKRNKSFFYAFRLSLNSLVLLLLLSFIFSCIGQNSNLNIETSHNILRNLLVIFLLACFEELLYRDFLPNALHTVIAIENNSIFFLVEFFSCVLFAFGHLYAGILSVEYAFLAGIILRIVTWKTNCIFFACAIHVIYNMLIYTFYAILQ